MEINTREESLQVVAKILRDIESLIVAHYFNNYHCLNLGMPVVVGRIRRAVVASLK